MRDSAFLDQLMADAWPPTVSEMVGRSRLRWAPGFTRRANSCLAVGDDDEITAIVAGATKFYSMRHADPVFMVSTASAPPLMASHLHSLSFESTARTLLQTASSAVVAASCDGANAFVVESSTEMTDGWFETYWAVEATRDRDQAARTICRPGRSTNAPGSPPFTSTPTTAPPVQTLHLVRSAEPRRVAGEDFGRHSRVHVGAAQDEANPLADV
jgi:hypothetical protein